MKRYLLMDSTTRSQFRGDFPSFSMGKLIEKLREETLPDKLDATFFYQYHTKLRTDIYEDDIAVIEKGGWKVDKCLDDKNVYGAGYASVVEALALSVTAIQTLEDIYHREEQAELILAVNHLSYAAVMKKIKGTEFYNDTRLSVLGNVTHLNQAMLEYSDATYSVSQFL